MRHNESFQFVTKLMKNWFFYRANLAKGINLPLEISLQSTGDETSFAVSEALTRLWGRCNRGP